MAATPRVRPRCFLRRQPGTHLLVRKPGLADTMSRYLIRRIEEHSAITLPDANGAGRAERRRAPRSRPVARWSCERRRNTSHQTRVHDDGRGARTGWLDGCVALDGSGFIKTGPDLSPEDLTAASWPPGAVAVSTGNDSSRGLRGRRRAPRQHQARRLRGRRRIDRRRICSSSSSPVKDRRRDVTTVAVTAAPASRGMGTRWTRMRMISRRSSTRSIARGDSCWTFDRWGQLVSDVHAMKPRR